MMWLQFIISAAVIILAGVQLTKSADILSDRLNIGKAWMGVILLGVITSLPEAIASLTAVISLNAADLAIGNLVGSNNFNPLLIVVMDIAYRQGSITNKISCNHSHKLSALLFVVMILVVFSELMMPFRGSVFGLFSLEGGIVVLIYFVGMRKLSQVETQHSSVVKGAKSVGDVPLKKIYIQLSISAILVVFSAIWIAKVCDTIAVETGLGGTFVGSIFLAVVTSLPEMVVSLAALRMNSFDLAIGNIFGSNMTNTFLIVVCDMFYQGGHILSAASRTHMVTIVLSIVLTLLVLIGLKIKNKKTILGLGWDSILLTAFFLIGTRILYQLR